MEPRKTKATKATKATGTAKRTPRATTAAKSDATPAKRTRTPKATTPAKRTPAKTAPKATGPRLTGPTRERIALAKTVATARARGDKWNEIAASTGKAEPTLAKLRKDVRAGVFANLSPAKDRVPADAF